MNKFSVEGTFSPDLFKQCLCHIAANQPDDNWIIVRSDVIESILSGSEFLLQDLENRHTCKIEVFSSGFSKETTLLFWFSKETTKNDDIFLFVTKIMNEMKSRIERSILEKTNKYVNSVNYYNNQISAIEKHF